MSEVLTILLMPPTCTVSVFKSKTSQVSSTLYITVLERLSHSKYRCHLQFLITEYTQSTISKLLWMIEF